MTVKDLLTGALQDLLLVPGGGGVPDTSDLELARSRLNDYIDHLKNEGLTVYTNSRQTWTLTGAASYTIGTGATINVERPVSPNAILNIGYIDTAPTPDAEVLCGPPLTEQEYENIPFKALTASFPSAFYYNPTYSAQGYGLIMPFPIPSASGLQGVIYVPSPVSEFTALTQQVILPPGFRRFFRNQCVVEIAGAFEKADKAAVARAMENAKESKAAIKRTNERLVDVTFDPALLSSGGSSNVYTGE